MGADFIVLLHYSYELVTKKSLYFEEPKTKEP